MAARLDKEMAKPGIQENHFSYDPIRKFSDYRINHMRKHRLWLRVAPDNRKYQPCVESRKVVPTEH